ncbi:hypothetical protein PRIPAC_84599 [Pristionchus pacificus]|uniref:CSRNP_N domain-containing protein n=1 Tax=Pristionchus pacificus TaxID=54126 RepID=A0A2A6BK50_PRIPA|nr:hypothetical protein PRIPAC_84599 [Pristionchus pacificus]|eukprot:PDM66295.1 hypothetical protein PRIPAC_47712 [Pristionchus pacificus]
MQLSEDARYRPVSLVTGREREAGEKGATPERPLTRSSPRRKPLCVDVEEEDGRMRRSMAQPLDDKQRRAILKASGVKLPKTQKSALERQPIEAEDEKLETIRQRRRDTAGCSCGAGAGCDPFSCECSRAGITCQMDTMEHGGFPCRCTAADCRNENGRQEFNEVLVRTHWARTLARLRTSEQTVDRRQEG